MTSCWADPDVDLVYIATPHSPHASRARPPGRPRNILVESRSPRTRRRPVRCSMRADGSGLLCTEAIWTRYAVAAIVDRTVASGAIGDRSIFGANQATSGVGQGAVSDPGDGWSGAARRRRVPAQFHRHGDGAATARCRSSASRLPMTPYALTGVDAQNSTTLYYANGVMAVSTPPMPSPARPCGLHLGRQGVRAVRRNITNISRSTYGADHAVAEHMMCRRS